MIIRDVCFDTLFTKVGIHYDCSGEISCCVSSLEINAILWRDVHSHLQSKHSVLSKYRDYT